MICPKCGFEQEERLDCKECGIVFSKYNALFPSEEPPDPEKEVIVTRGEFREMQIQINEVSSRLIEADFEKAERKKLRSDIKDLEEYTAMNRMEMETRLRSIEGQLERSREEKIPLDVLENLPGQEEVEQKTAQLSETINGMADKLTVLWEKTGQNSFQVSELRGQIVSLHNDVLELKNQIEDIRASRVNDEPRTILEDDVKAIRKNLDELGQFISGLGRKQ